MRKINKIKRPKTLSFLLSPITKRQAIHFDKVDVTSSNLVSPTERHLNSRRKPVIIGLFIPANNIQNSIDEGQCILVDYVPLMCHFFRDMCHFYAKTRGVSSIRQSASLTSKRLSVQIRYSPQLTFDEVVNP